VRLAESTVQRLLARRRLMKKRPDEPTAKDRRRFEHESAGDLWMSDVMHGPKAKDGTRLQKTYLIAFVDDATRLVPHAACALSEGAVVYLTMLEQAGRKAQHPQAPVRGQWRRVPLEAPRARLRQARHRAHPASLPRRAAAVACSETAP
jgi:hypothetical protein